MAGHRVFTASAAAVVAILAAALTPTAAHADTQSINLDFGGVRVGATVVLDVTFTAVNGMLVRSSYSTGDDPPFAIDAGTCRASSSGRAPCTSRSGPPT